MGTAQVSDDACTIASCARKAVLTAILIAIASATAIPTNKHVGAFAQVGHCSGGAAGLFDSHLVGACPCSEGCQVLEAYRGSACRTHRVSGVTKIQKHGCATRSDMIAVLCAPNQIADSDMIAVCVQRYDLCFACSDVSLFNLIF